MNSQLITFPDQIRSDHSILLINSLDREVENLVVYLKISPITFDIHFYHSYMNDYEQVWAHSVSKFAKIILVNKDYCNIMTKDMRETCESNSVTRYYGSGTNFAEPVDFFRNFVSEY